MLLFGGRYPQYSTVGALSRLVVDFSPKDAPHLDQSHAAAQAFGGAEQTSQLCPEGSAPAGPCTRAES